MIVTFSSIIPRQCLCGTYAGALLGVLAAATVAALLHRTPAGVLRPESHPDTDRWHPAAMQRQRAPAGSRVGLRRIHGGLITVARA
jgi:hypothetical protein